MVLHWAKSSLYIDAAEELRLDKVSNKQMYVQDPAGSPGLLI